MGVALGLPPTGFRFLQIGNGSVSVWRINKQAKPILVTLNLTAHISTDDIFYEAPFVQSVLTHWPALMRD